MHISEGGVKTTRDNRMTALFQSLAVIQFKSSVPAEPHQRPGPTETDDPATASDTITADCYDFPKKK